MPLKRGKAGAIMTEKQVIDGTRFEGSAHFP